MRKLIFCLSELQSLGWERPTTWICKTWQTNKQKRSLCISIKISIGNNMNMHYKVLCLKLLCVELHSVCRTHSVWSYTIFYWRNKYNKLKNSKLMLLEALGTNTVFLVDTLQNSKHSNVILGVVMCIKDDLDTHISA